MPPYLKPLLPVFWLLILAVSVIVIIKAVTSKSSEQKKGPIYSYYIVRSLLSEYELSFYHLLHQIVASRYSLFAKVNVYDVLRASRESSSTLGARSKVNRWHFDFLICDQKTLAPLAAVELDDSSHERPDRVERDKSLNDACASAGLKLLRYRSPKDLVAANLLAQLAPPAPAQPR